MIDPGVLIDKINSLDCAGEIAAFFKEQNVCAFPGEPEQCAIAQYVMHNAEVWAVHVDGQKVTTYKNNVYDVDCEFPLSEAAKEFVVKFDNKEFEEITHSSVLEDDDDDEGDYY